MLSHVLRAAYFGSLDGIGELSPWMCGAGIVLAIAGTSLAPYVIERMTDHGFRQWTRWIVFTVSTVYVVRAGWLFWQG